MRSARGSRAILLAVGAGLALADSSIVALALPELLADLHTTIVGVSAVVAVYTIVLAIALIPAWRLIQRIGARTAGAAGLALFALASAACGLSDALPALLVARGVQAVGGAAALMAVFAVLHDGPSPRRRLWLTAAVLGTAIGPALGGVLTQLLDWRAIFLVQVPVAAVGATVCLGAPARVPERTGPPGERPALGPAAALASVSAALTGVLLLLVLLLVAGWNLEPLEAAAIVTALPLGALVGARIRHGTARARAMAGCLLVGGGVLAIAWLPDADPAWTLGPQLVAGIGMGLSLPALAGQLLPERRGDDAAALLTIRHVGIALALVLVAPITADRLDTSTTAAKLQGIAIVLDARLPPQDKLRVAPRLLSSVESQEPRRSLRSAVARERSRFAGERRVTYDRLGARADDVLVTAVGRAFRPAFVVLGALALLGALCLTDRWRTGSGVAAAAALAVLVPAGYAVAHDRLAAAPVTIADPCRERRSPDSGGVSGFLQDQALKAVDKLACANGSSREELVLALANGDEARAYDRRYGVNPRSPGGIFEQGKRLLGIG